MALKVSIAPQDHMQPLQANRFLRPPQAAAYVGISIRQLYRLAKIDESFPKLQRLSSNTTVIERAALDAWADAKINSMAEAA